jgi:hypothetical protein
MYGWAYGLSVGFLPGPRHTGVIDGRGEYYGGAVPPKRSGRDGPKSGHRKDRYETMAKTLSKLSVKHTLGRAVSIAIAALAICWVSVAGAAPSHAAAMRPATNAPLYGCVFQTINGNYLTANGGGGLTDNALHTDAVRIGAWEKFTLVDSGDGSSPIHYGIQTYHGYYLTAVNGGGQVYNAIQSNRPWLSGWEKFTLISLGNGWYAIQTSDGHYVTAQYGGGMTNDYAVQTNRTWIQGWEEFRITCGH